MTEIAAGLRFPEGPVAMPDGSVLFVEIARGTLSRAAPDGTVDVVAHLGGGPNGAAMGPDGKCYVCNNGGFQWFEKDGALFSGLQGDDYSGGRIERVDLATGAVEVLYDSCDGAPLRGPNDIVFDRHGGFWFTDHGKTRARDLDRTGVYYARWDGSAIRRVIFPLHAPNGIGLSADERTLYVAETPTARLLAFDLAEPGRIVKGGGETRWMHGRLLAARPDYTALDSLAVDGAGKVCVGTLFTGGIWVVDPADGSSEFVPMPDPWPTNICFGGADLCTAYVTLSSSGRLVSLPWPRPGLALNFLDRPA
ncbi:MAG: SMP-30/gluconolactonase/LRE family protein [Hyphomicrobiales bacterium]|nr:SMP-30/gluconolactonase/LRE family protein [Hyphomicrobiales bacterium]MCP5370703.1 SMP-30/gluconolactonase/LRE family protein [Hyphomicrobiales bacterium]